MPKYESTRRAIANYHKYKLKRVPLDLNKKDFEERIKPAIDRSGMPVQTFIKAAIEEKIRRDGLFEESLETAEDSESEKDSESANDSETAEDSEPEKNEEKKQ